MLYVALSASQGHVWLNQSDQTLDEQLLEQFLVSSVILAHLIVHLDFCFALQTLNELVDHAHALDSLLVLLSRLLDLEVDFGGCEVFLELLTKPLLFSFNCLLFADREIVLSLALDLVDTFITMGLDELDHAI